MPRSSGRRSRKIAGEKAGILKRGVAGVLAPQDEDVMKVIAARAAAVHAPLVVAGRDYDAYEQSGRLVVQREDLLLDLPLPALLGRHQIANAGNGGRRGAHALGSASGPGHR